MKPSWKDTLLAAWSIVTVSSALGLAVNHLRGLPLHPLKAYTRPFVAPRVEAKEAYAQLGAVLFIDSRSTRIYQQGHIIAALNLRKGDLRLDHIDHRQAMIVYCELFCPLADEAAFVLHEKGFSDVSVLSGGFSSWQFAGYPVQTGPEDPAWSKL
jgi:rhodanese-related sulfurtransferase